jgi:hypothetical protein
MGKRRGGGGSKAAAAASGSATPAASDATSPPPPPAAAAPAIDLAPAGASTPPAPPPPPSPPPLSAAGIISLLRAAARSAFGGADNDHERARAAAAARLLIGATWEGVQWVTLCAVLFGVCASWIAAARSDPFDTWFPLPPPEALPPRVARPYGGDASVRQTRAYAGFEGAGAVAPAPAAAPVEERTAHAASPKADVAAAAVVPPAAELSCGAFPCARSCARLAALCADARTGAPRRRCPSCGWPRLL